MTHMLHRLITKLSQLVYPAVTAAFIALFRHFIVKMNIRREEMRILRPNKVAPSLCGRPELQKRVAPFMSTFLHFFRSQIE